MYTYQIRKKEYVKIIQIPDNPSILGVLYSDSKYLLFWEHKVYMKLQFFVFFKTNNVSRVCWRVWILPGNPNPVAIFQMVHVLV